MTVVMEKGQQIIWIFLILDVYILISQARLPEARVVYCSATGASEPRNMGYMVRLGLWGPGTSFIDFRDFLGENFAFLLIFQTIATYLFPSSLLSLIK